jgi:hypothetical protein
MSVAVFSRANGFRQLGDEFWVQTIAEHYPFRDYALFNVQVQIDDSPIKPLFNLIGELRDVEEQPFIRN